MAAVPSTLRPRLAGLALLAVAVAYASTALVAPLRSGATPLTTYAGASFAADVLDLAAGLGLVAAALVAWIEPRTRRLALLTLLAGVAWFGPDWEGWYHGPALIRSLGACASPLFVALVFHLVVAFPVGRLRSRAASCAVASVYLIAACVSVGRALFRDPLLDLHCWRNCLSNSFLVHADPSLARMLDAVWLRAALGIAAVLVGVAVWRLAVASAAARRALWLGLVPAALVGATEAAYAAALLHTPFENPQSAGFAAIFVLRSLAVLSLALGLAWSVVRIRRTRAAVTRLVGELGDAPPPGKLRGVLASALADEGVEVIYPLGDSRRFVDGYGHPVAAPATGNGRVVTTVARAGRPVALVAHDAALIDGDGLERQMGAAAILAVENERLQAQVLAQLEDLRASRGRIVERGDAERCRLERDLHDGAQQRLLALHYDLRLAQAGADADGAIELAASLHTAGIEVQAALTELRELAQGIYPAVLAEAGLAPAIETFADGTRVRLDLGEVTTERFRPAVESSAYVTVAEAVDDAAARGATQISVDVIHAGDRLVVEVHDDGCGRRSHLIHIADRIGALGGSLDAGRQGLRAEIPCG